MQSTHHDDIGSRRSPANAGADEPTPPLGPVARFLLVAGVGYLACLLTQLVGFNRLEQMPFWPAAGVAFAFGWRYGSIWTLPAAAGASLWAALQTGAPELVIGAALVTIAGPLAALAVLRRLNDWKPAEYRLEAAIRLLVAVICVSAPLNALLATGAIAGSNLLIDTHPLHLLASWWLVDALGTLLLAPVIVATARFEAGGTGRRRRANEPWLDVPAVSLTGVIVLASLLLSEIGHQPYAAALAFFFVPVAAFTSIRGSEKTTTVTLLVTATMILAMRALQLSAPEPTGPPMIETSLMVFVAVVVALLLQAIAADRRLALERVAQQARQDMSTGLLNDRGLLAELGERLAAADRPDYGLVGLHLSNIDTLNDLCGAVPVLQLEQSIAGNLLSQPSMRAAARLSAGRYVVLLHAGSLHEVRAIARELYSSLAGQVFRTQHGSIRLQASVGGLLVDRQAAINGEDCLVSLADAQAIAASVRDPQLFVEPLSQTMIDARRAHQSKIEQIRESIIQGRFQIHAQPIVDAQAPDGRLSYEVLIRLVDRDGGLVRPPEFLSLAVQAQMTPAMDRGVIARVFEWLSQNPQALERTHKCSINLSGLTMSDALISSFIREQRQRFGIPADRVVFEITESEAIRNPGAASRLVDELKAEGFGIAIDDFGVGLATFEYLKRFSPDFLKIDGSFIRNLIESPIDEEIVLSTVRVARRLNVQTVAEHVQSQAIYDRLQTLGVGHFQGEHLGRVVPIEALFAGAASGNSSGAPQEPAARQRGDGSRRGDRAPVISLPRAPSR